MHSLILGTTASGKTTLAKRLCSEYRDNGIKCIYLDPIGDVSITADFKTSDQWEFLEIVKRSQNCMIFVDESGEVIGQHEKEMFWLATRARHNGHVCHFLAQRAAQISPTVRDQCSTLFLFRVSVKDAETIAHEFVCEDLRAAHSLEQGEFFYYRRFGGVERRRLFGP